MQINLTFYVWWTLKQQVDNKDQNLIKYNDQIQEISSEINNLAERKIYINNEVEKIRQTRQEGPVQIKQEELRNIEKKYAELNDEIKDLKDDFKDHEKEMKENKKELTELQRT